MTINWDAYRRAYDKMTYGQVAEFHRVIWSSYPEQSQHSAEHLLKFFDGLTAPRVVEVGGWRGEAASALLDRFPAIVSWDNYEVCEPAVTSSVTTDPRYRGIFPDRWPWEVETDRRYDAAVLSHVIEHLRSHQVVDLVAWLRRHQVQDVFIEVPLTEQKRTWRGYEGAHVIDIGIAGLIDVMRKAGYVLRERDFHEPESHVLVFG